MMQEKFIFLIKSGVISRMKNILFIDNDSKHKNIKNFILNLLIFTLLAILGCERVFSNDNFSLNKNVDFKVVGNESVIFSANDWHCSETNKYGKLDVPDATVRAVRLVDGKIILFASHYNNLIFQNSNWKHLVRINCKSAFISGEDADASHFSDHEWVVSPYTQDGNKIFALVHNEHWGGLYDPVCKLRLGFKAPWDSICLYANITAAFSIDAAQSFVKPKIENRVVAAIQYPFSSDMDRVGVRDPSNMFLNPRDSKIYFLAYVDKYREQKRGMCLFQNDNIANPLWHVWDGVDFTKSMGNPYNNNQKTPPVTCFPVLGDLYVSSVVYHQNSGLFLGVGSDDKVGGIFFVTSPNLLTWSTPTLVIPGKSQNIWKPGDLPPQSYASLIDEESSSLNYDTVSDKAYIYFIRERIKDNKVQGLDRDIVKVPVSIMYKK